MDSLGTGDNSSTAAYRDEHLAVRFDRAAIEVDSREFTLTRKEHELLSVLVANAGEIIPRDVLLQSVWGYSREIRTRTLDVHIRRLRKKLGRYGEQYIETIFGAGYRFQRFREPRAFPAFTPDLAVI